MYCSELNEGRNCVVYELGSLTEGTHCGSNGFLWPVGFKSERQFASTRTPGKTCPYTCEIIESGQGPPRFKITPGDCEEEVVEGATPGEVWAIVLDRVNALRSRTYEEQVNTSDRLDANGA